MKLKYRTWHLKAPAKCKLDLYSRFPVAMIEQEPAYLTRAVMQETLAHASEGGLRVAQEWTLVYVQIPGYKTSIMNPDFDRWNSFGNWDDFTQLPNTALDLKDWVTIVDLTNIDSPVLVTLEEWVRTKTLYAWRDMVSQRRYERKMVR